MSTIDFKEWNNAFRKLKYRHDTWYIFRDFLDMTIDNFTIPDQTPLFEHRDKYTEEEYGYFGELFSAYIHSMQAELEKRPYCDFLGEWWEADQDMTNKFNAQFFTPSDVCDVMCQLTLDKSLGSESRVMYDCCCGSGRFALAYHKYRPNDWFFLVDVDEMAIKMTLINMVLHGMRGVVCWGNALTLKCFQCWVVSPSLLEYGGLPYIVPMGENIAEALAYLPGDNITEAPTNQLVEDKSSTINSDKEERIPVHPQPKTGGLDAWLNMG